MKKTVSFILALVLIFSLGACKKGPGRYEAEFLVLFDTLTRIVGYADSKEEFSRFSQFVYDELREYHELYDIYNEYEGKANIKTINDNAGAKPVKVDPRIIDLLLFAREQYEKTGGKVNVAFGAVLELWHDYRELGTEDPENASLPPPEALQEAALHCDIDNMVIDEAASTVYLSDPLMSLDVGAVAKGYATEQVCLLAEERGYASALLSVGGNVRAIGGKPEGGGPWSVGVQDPAGGEDGTANLCIVSLSQASLVTSGNYERFYSVDGKNYHHIINPETLYPSEYFTAVTILCPDSGIADALSTAVFNLPLDEGRALIESLADTEALWVMPDGTLEYSSGFKQRIVQTQ